MKRLHLHLVVADLDRSITFYNALLGATPSVKKPKYAKWLLDDPAVNLAISSDKVGKNPGVDHVGIETSSRDDLDAIAARLKEAGEKTVDRPASHCCYAVSDKTWAKDPSKIKWEAFFTHGETATGCNDGEDAELAAAHTRADPVHARGE